MILNGCSSFSVNLSSFLMVILDWKSENESSTLSLLVALVPPANTTQIRALLIPWVLRTMNSYRAVALKGTEKEKGI
jgi:hypothetical protein